MTAKHIHVDAFHLFFTYPFHLYVYAFPAAYRRFCHTSQTRAASPDSTVRLPLLPVPSAQLRFVPFDTERNQVVRSVSQGWVAVAAYHAELAVINVKMLSFLRDDM